MGPKSNVHVDEILPPFSGSSNWQQQTTIGP